MKIELLKSKLIPEKAAKAGFTTRIGGCSDYPYESMNLGIKIPDNSLDKNYGILLEHLNINNNNIALMEQIHTANVTFVESGGIYPSTDSIVTDKPGILLCVQVADCIPLIIFDKTGKAAAVHCGWKPIVANIIEKTFNFLSQELGTKAENIYAVMGPSAGPCCYEIGAELAGLLSPDAVIEKDGHLFGDLKTEVMKRLKILNILENKIENINYCTICNENLFYSYRRDKEKSGRMLGYISING